jgi:hypothetical protein
MLKPAYPSSPSRKPIEHLYFAFFDQDNEQQSFFTIGFSAAYAAHHWLDRVMSSPATQRWIDSNHIELEHDGYRLIIKGSQLEDMIEYKPTKEEASWRPSHPDSVTLEHTRHFWTKMSSASITIDSEKPTTNSTPAPVSSRKPPKRHKTTKPAPDGQITVAMICEELDLAPNKGRNILRKANIKKPKQGWSFKSNDPQLKTIRDLLSRG